MSHLVSHPTEAKETCSDHTSKPYEPERVHILCEEYEGENGIREFTILAVSRDKETLRKLMQAKIEKDEYGIIHQNGIDIDCEDMFSCVFDDGYVCYEIREEELQTTAQLQAMLNTQEYNPQFAYPATLDQALEPTLNKIAESYVTFDTQKALAHIKADKRFQNHFKTTWWGDRFDSLTGDFRNHIIRFLQDYVKSDLAADPNYFIDAGAAAPYQLPKNTKQLLISTIYEVSGDAQLPVNFAGVQAEQIMQNESFLKVFQNYGSEAIEFGSQNYENALWTCQKFVRSLLLKEPEQRLETKVTDAVQRQKAQVGDRQNNSISKER